MRPLLLALALLSPLAAFGGDAVNSMLPIRPVTPARRNPALHGPNEFSFFAAGTTNSARIIALSDDRRLSIIGARYGRRLFDSSPLAITWTADLDPIVLLSQPRNLRGHNLGGREWIYGGAVSPFGVRFDLLTRHRLQPFFNASAGMVWFSRPAPYSDATKRNYMFEAGFGVRYFERHGRALTLGWKMNHISNNYRVPDNPGIDSGMLYTGFSFFK